MPEPEKKNQFTIQYTKYKPDVYLRFESGGF